MPARDPFQIFRDLVAEGRIQVTPGPPVDYAARDAAMTRQSVMASGFAMNYGVAPAAVAQAAHTSPTPFRLLDEVADYAARLAAGLGVPADMLQEGLAFRCIKQRTATYPTVYDLIARDILSNEPTPGDDHA